MRRVINIALIACLSLLICACSSEATKELLPESRQDFCSQIHLDGSASLLKELKPFDSLVQSKTGVYILEEGGNSLLGRAWLSENAEQSIDIQYFIFSTDNVGLIACDYLVRAADRGVKVRILVDDILVDAGIHEIVTLDSHPNIDIKIYNPGVNLGKNITDKIKSFVGDFRKANQRMHNKTFIVDGKVVITGGRNVADEYFDYDHEYNFRDRDVLLLGKVVKDVSKSFETFWDDNLSTPVTQLVLDTIKSTNPNNKFERLHQYACNPQNFWPQVREQIAKLPEAFHNIVESGNLVWVDSVKFVSDFPGKNTAATHNLGGLTTFQLAKLIRNAKQTVDIQSPYLITTSISKKLLADAVKRGVKVRILTNSLASTDNVEAFSGYARDRHKLLETGVRVFEFRPDAQERFKMMTGALQSSVSYTPVFGQHAKSMVIDGNITVVGTFNLDPRSANLNTECVTIIYSDKVSQTVLKYFEIDFLPENSWETTKYFNPDSKASRSKRFKVKTRRVVPKDIL